MARARKTFALLLLRLPVVSRFLAAEPQAVSIPRLSQPPRLEDFEEMRPQGAATQLAKISGFIQNQPTDGAPGTQPTDVYLGYDAKNLYVIWVCFDDPSKTQAHVTSREGLPDGMDDQVEITLDTYSDRRHGFLFRTNAYGVQSDALWAEPGGTDFSFDAVWSSRGKFTARGYLVWMAIPFRSLRFPQGQKQPAWGFTLQRIIQRNNEWDFWPAVSKRIAGRLNQAAELCGLEGISHGGNMQFTPYEVFRSFRGLDTRDYFNPSYDQATARFRQGVDSKFIFHDSLVLDATVNPDFSQVESDSPQVTVNQRWDVYFPEKRPFFLENSTLFDLGGTFLPGVTPSSLVFTRNIQDPEFGVRLTGKQGPYTLAFLATDDRGPGESVAPGDPMYKKRADFAIAHVSREIGSQSSIGAIYTDREFFGGWNRIGGLDGNFKLDRNWNLSFRSVASSTMTPDGKYSAGPYHEATLTRQGLSFNETLLLQDISPGFESQVGFVPRRDLRRIANYTGYIFRPVNRSLLSHGPEGTVEVDHDHDGTLVQYNVSADWAFEFKRQMLFMPIYRLEVDTLRPQDFFGLTRNLTFARDGGGFMFFGTPWKQLQFNLTVNDQGGVNVVPPAGQVPTLGNELNVTLSATVNPTSRLKIDNTYILDRLTANRGENAAFNNHIFRSKWSYQFTPKLSLRLIPQYTTLLANPLYTSLPTTKQVNFDFLLTYLVHPGTALYVGYNSNLENLDRGLCSRMSTGACDPYNPGLLRDPRNFINDGRQFFIKLSYLFRP